MVAYIKKGDYYKIAIYRVLVFGVCLSAYAQFLGSYTLNKMHFYLNLKNICPLDDAIE